MWTETVDEEAPTAVEAPLFDEDSVTTAPLARALVEAPTTIFDPPPRRPARGSAPHVQRMLDASYEAAMRHFR